MVVDVQRQPSLAVRDKVTVESTLVKRHLAPLCGLSDTNWLRLGLDGTAGGRPRTEVPCDGPAAFGLRRWCPVGFPVTTDDARAALPGDPWRNCAELAEARATLRTIRAGEVGALVIDSGSGEEVFTSSRADRP